MTENITGVITYCATINNKLALGGLPQTDGPTQNPAAQCRKTQEITGRLTKTSAATTTKHRRPHGGPHQCANAPSGLAQRPRLRTGV